MPLYRIDVQNRIPYEDNPSGYYWYTNVYYVNASDFDELDQAIDAVLRAGEFSHRHIVMMDYYRVMRWPSGVVVLENEIDYECTPLISGPYYSIYSCLYVRLYNGDRQVSYKRYRTPLSEHEIDDQRLTSDFYNFWSSSPANFWEPAGIFTNSAGVPITRAMLDPYVHGWVLRHGTKRRERRRLA